MLVRILAAVGSLLVALLVIIAMQPDYFTLTRSTTVAASPQAVFAQVNDFHAWPKWSPWAKLDPSMKSTYTGPESGVGASYAWMGNEQVGEGKMTIIKAQPFERIDISLEFISPMAATNLTEFTFKPEGENTLVTWTMSGKNNFIAKAFHLFIDMDKMVGDDFEKGLAQLKTTVESSRPL
jgi:hypothetical protein